MNHIDWGAGAAVLIVWALGLSLLLLAYLATRFLPVGGRLWRMGRRFIPGFQAMIVFALLAWTLWRSLGWDPWLGRGAVAALTVGMLWAGRGMASDWVSGIILKAEGILEPSAWVRIGSVEGHVHRVGLRVLELEAEDGRRFRLPFSTITPAAIIRRPEEEAGQAYSFEFPVDPRAERSELYPRIRRAALMSPWSSPNRTPLVTTIDDARVRVTVYPLEVAYGVAVEARVHQVLDEARESESR